MLEYLPTRRSAGGSCCLTRQTQSSFCVGISGKFYCIPIASLPSLFSSSDFLLSLSPPISDGGGEAPPVFFTPPQAREMLRHIDDVDTCVLSVCLSFLLACFLSFVFACSVLVYTSSPVSSLPHCATFIPLIFLLGNGPPRREDYPTAISNADVCKQMLAGNEECS